MALSKRLGNIAVGGFFACCVSYYAFQRAVSKALMNSDFCKEAVELVKSHDGAKQFLGEPIELTSAKFLNYDKNPVKYVQILVSGPKSNGKIFITYTANKEKKQELKTVQLQIGKDDSKRLEIKS